MMIGRKRGKARILTKIAHSILKPLLKRLHEAGKMNVTGTNAARITPNIL